jgi:hypothetical protein
MSTAQRMSIAELRDIQTRAAAQPSMAAMRDNPAEKQRRGQKYGNQKVVDQGITFDSKAEHKRWQYLVMLERAGEIKDLQLQTPFELIPAQVMANGRKVRSTVYLADFTYQTKDGQFVCEDVKGAATDVWKLKQKLMLHVHGIEVQEIRS